MPTVGKSAGYARRPKLYNSARILRCGRPSGFWALIGARQRTRWHSPVSLELLARTVQWAVIVILLFFSFALLYRFGPNLKDRRWQWSIPGADVADLVACLHIAAPDVPGALQFLKDLWGD